jgi:hypothetical protein
VPKRSPSRAKAASAFIVSCQLYFLKDLVSSRLLGEFSIEAR